MTPTPPRRAAWPLASRLFAAALSLFALLFALPARAAFTPPALTGHVVDTAGKLGAEDINALDQKLERVRQRTGFDIVAFIAGSLEGEDIEDVAYKAFNAWKLGQKGTDNGVLLVIAPAERRVRIETGKGVGGALTDLQSNDIIRNTINPLLRQDLFREAIDQGTTAIARTLVQGTPGSKPPAPAAREPLSPLTIGVGVGAVLLVIILAIFSPAFRSILFFFLLFGRGGGGGGFGGGGIGRGGSSGGGGSSDSY
jgi:uncharacterized protein